MQDINKLLIITGASLAATLVLGYHVVMNFGDSIRIAKTNEACSTSLSACYKAESTYKTEMICKTPVYDESTCNAELQ